MCVLDFISILAKIIISKAEKVNLAKSGNQEDIFYEQKNSCNNGQPPEKRE